MPTKTKTPTIQQLIERWENAIRVLRALTPHERKNHWSMSTWGIKTECGTVQCAAGHCANDPWFRRRGFKYNPNWAKDYRLKKYRGCASRYAFGMTPDQFFGERAFSVFYNTNSRSVRDVINEMKGHIRGLKAELKDVA